MLPRLEIDGPMRITRDGEGIDFSLLIRATLLLLSFFGEEPDGSACTALRQSRFPPEASMGSVQCFLVQYLRTELGNALLNIASK